MSKDFDKFIKNKFENRTFDFKDEYWAEAEEMFAAAVPKKSLFQRLGGWWFVASVIGIIGLGIGLTVSDTFPKSEKQAISAMTETDQEDSEITRNMNVTNTRNIENQKQDLTIDKGQITNDVTENTTLSSEQGISQTAVTNGVGDRDKKQNRKEKSITESLTSTKTSIKQDLFNKSASKITKSNFDHQKTTKKIQKTPYNTSSDININTPKDTSFSKSIAPTTFEKELTKQSKNASLNPPLKNIEGEQPKNKRTPTAAKSQKNKSDILNQNNKIDQHIKTKETTQTIVLNTNKKEEKSNIPIVLIDFLKTPLFAVEGNQAMATLDHKNAVTSPKEEQFSRYLTFSAVVGGHYATPFENGAANPATQFSLNPIFGVKAGYGLNKKIDVHLGVLTYNRTQTNTTIQTNALTYSFGFQQTTNNISIDKLRFVEIPVYGSYRFTEKAEVLFGVVYANLFSTVSRVEEFTANSHNTLSLTNQSTVDNYMEGLRRHDVGLLTGIQYRFSPLMTIGGQLKYGFRDITDNAYYGNDSYDRNIQFRVMLTFDLLNRNL